MCELAGVGKTFIYDNRHPELTKTVLAARDASQVAATTRAEQNVDERNCLMAERALNAEAHIKEASGRTSKNEMIRIADLIGQLYDPDGTHLADENARLRDLLAITNQNLQEAHAWKCKPSGDHSTQHGPT